MPKLLNSAVKVYLKLVHGMLERSITAPIEAQEKVFNKLIFNFKNTKYGKLNGIKHVKNYESYHKAYPVVTYDHLKPFIERMMKGESDVLIGGNVRFFSKSSGTTNDKSKFIPVTRANLYKNHLKSAWDSLSLFYRKRPDAELFNKKSLMISGSLSHFPEYPKAIVGDISAIMTKNMPTIARSFYTPDLEIAMLSDWNEKIARITEQVGSQDVVMFGGVPTWLLVTFRELLKKQNKENLLEIWPNLQGYLHGGVGFSPYVEQFKALIPSKDFIYQEIYNASEGFFGIQQHNSDEDMLLLVNNSVFYEFLPMSEWEKDSPEAIPLKDVETGKPYAILITSNNGLARYMMGDVVEFSSTCPYKFKIKGRTQHYINIFGEEVMVDNTDKALAMTCQATGSSIDNYTVGPIYLTTAMKGGHEWIVEFNKKPEDINAFGQLLDNNLRTLNSDYDAKRSYDLALMPLKLTIVPVGTFHRWLQSRNKLGGQNKVPRLANHRNYIDALLEFGDSLAKTIT
ncbi:MAG: GH3 auxin-responsive promoter family protein [Saprospiraceae bacterium]|nr:MAG: GH3 auxin-responsive promoter [Candidatus Parvibacillus calidus]MCC7147902.1 GH3 auxin-responsive promoter family protein [Saprospiraceae bacterium]WKZ62917.1 MAG: GH3 auxin-responsive promoter family protein [Saprospiraceae bacterium]